MCDERQVPARELLQPRDRVRPAPLRPVIGSTQTEADRIFEELDARTALADGLTMLQFLQKLTGARGHLTVGGTPERVAHAIEDWFISGAAEGFNVMPPVICEQLELFAQ